jgi:hypothetical protein
MCAGRCVLFDSRSSIASDDADDMRVDRCRLARFTCRRRKLLDTVAIPAHCHRGSTDTSDERQVLKSWCCRLGRRQFPEAIGRSPPTAWRDDPRSKRNRTVVPCRCTLRPFERIGRRLSLMRAELLANFCARPIGRQRSVRVPRSSAWHRCDRADDAAREQAVATLHISELGGQGKPAENERSRAENDLATAKLKT